jgi:hypothetical protein
MATLFLIVGLPGAGKTMRAMDLAEERLTPDAWMIPLFGDPQPVGKRDVLEGRLIWLAPEVLRLGTIVVLDFGLWTRDERSSLRWLAGSVGAVLPGGLPAGGPRDATRADQAPLDANTRSDVRDDRGRCGSMARASSTCLTQQNWRAARLLTHLADVPAGLIGLPTDGHRFRQISGSSWRQFLEERE